MPYSTNKTIEAALFGHWASSREVATCLKKLQGVDFSYVGECTLGFCALREVMNSAAPFDMDIRFPVDRRYIYMNDPNTFELFRALSTALSAINFYLLNMKDAADKTQYMKFDQDAVQEFNTILNKLNKKFYEGSMSVDRAEFEQEFNVTWTDPSHEKNQLPPYN